MCLDKGSKRHQTKTSTDRTGCQSKERVTMLKNSSLESRERKLESFVMWCYRRMPKRKNLENTWENKATLEKHKKKKGLAIRLYD